MFSRPAKIILIIAVGLYIAIRIYGYYDKKQLNEKAYNILEAANNALLYEKDTAGAIPLYNEFLKLKPDFLPVLQDLLPVYRAKGDSVKTKEYREKIERLTEPYVPTI